MIKYFFNPKILPFLIFMVWLVLILILMRFCLAQIDFNINNVRWERLGNTFVDKIEWILGISDDAQKKKEESLNVMIRSLEEEHLLELNHKVLEERRKNNTPRYKMIKKKKPTVVAPVDVTTKENK